MIPFCHFCRCKHDLPLCMCAYCQGHITKPSEYGLPSLIDRDLSNYYKLSDPDILTLTFEEMEELW